MIYESELEVGSGSEVEIGTGLVMGVRQTGKGHFSPPRTIPDKVTRSA